MNCYSVGALVRISGAQMRTDGVSSAKYSIIIYFLIGLLRECKYIILRGGDVCLYCVTVEIRALAKCYPLNLLFYYAIINL